LSLFSSGRNRANGSRCKTQLTLPELTRHANFYER
jgi:hypothetical protein